MIINSIGECWRVIGCFTQCFIVTLEALPDSANLKLSNFLKNYLAIVLFFYLHERTAVSSGAENSLLSLRLSISQGVSSLSACTHLPHREGYSLGGLILLFEVLVH